MLSKAKQPKVRVDLKWSMCRYQLAKLQEKSVKFELFVKMYIAGILWVSYK